MSRFNKAVVALLASVSTWGYTAWQSGAEITGDEWFGLIGVIGTAYGVYAITNTAEDTTTTGYPPAHPEG